jgi:hypothetical protein
MDKWWLAMSMLDTDHIVVVHADEQQDAIGEGADLFGEDPSDWTAVELTPHQVDELGLG